MSHALKRPPGKIICWQNKMSTKKTKQKYIQEKTKKEIATFREEENYIWKKYSKSNLDIKVFAKIKLAFFCFFVVSYFFSYFFFLWCLFCFCAMQKQQQKNELNP